MRKFLKKTINKIIALVVLLVVLYLIYANNGSVELNWLGYRAYTSIFVIACIFAIWFVWRYLMKNTRRWILHWMGRLTFCEELCTYTKNLHFHSDIEKEITLGVCRHIRDYKSFKIFNLLMRSVNSKDIQKLHSLLKKYKKQKQYQHICVYAEVKGLLFSRKAEEAANLCKSYLEIHKHSTWAFLQLCNIVFVYEQDSTLEFIRTWINAHRLRGSQSVLDKLYCLVNYKLLRQTGVTASSLKQVKALIKRYPTFVPSYVLMARYYSSQNDNEEALKYIVKSWYYNITVENTLMCESFFLLQHRDDLINQARSLIDNAYSEQTKEHRQLLLVFLYAVFQEFMQVRSEFVKIKDTSDPLYKIIKSYINVKEYSSEGYSTDHLSDLMRGRLPHSWWDDFVNPMPQ